MTRADGPERLHGGRDAAGQPAATDRDEDDREVRQVLDDLEADRALAGDDPVVVERRDDRQARARPRALGDASRSSLAVPTVTISAPSAATRSRLMAGASDGMTMTAGTPSSRAARATPWAWFPDE